MPNAYFQDTLFSISSQLDAPGFGTLVEVAANDGFRTTDYTLIAIVTNINTNVVVRLDGSIDGTNFAPIIADQTITANGSHAFSVSVRF